MLLTKIVPFVRRCKRTNEVSNHLEEPSKLRSRRCGTTNVIVQGTYVDLYFVNTFKLFANRRHSFEQELVALAGYAARVSEMLDVFKDAALCKYKRNVVTSGPSRLTNGNVHQSTEKTIEFSNGTPVIKGKLYILIFLIIRYCFKFIFIYFE